MFVFRAFSSSIFVQISGTLNFSGTHNFCWTQKLKQMTQMSCLEYKTVFWKNPTVLLLRYPKTINLAYIRYVTYPIHLQLSSSVAATAYNHLWGSACGRIFSVSFKKIEVELCKWIFNFHGSSCPLTRRPPFLVPHETIWTPMGTITFFDCIFYPS